MKPLRVSTRSFQTTPSKRKTSCHMRIGFAFERIFEPLVPRHNFLPGTPTSNGHVPGVAAKQPPCSWKNGVQGSELTTDTFRHRLDIEDSRPLTLRSSIPNSGVQIKFDTPTEESRWIFTPSYNRATPGSRQALLDRSAALHQDPDTSPDVGSR